MGHAQKKLNSFGLDALCERILDGRSITAIAQDIGVSVGSVISWIAAEPERSARVREARAATSQFWEEKAEASIESATDPFQLARARELAQHYRWRASKIDPKHYGDKQQIEHSGTLSIADELRAAKARRQQGADAGEG